MFRGAAVVHEDTAYFRPNDSEAVFSYQNILGEEKWAQLPDNLQLNCGLVVIEGLLTSVGGLTRELLSLVAEDGRKEWQKIFPPMSAQRSKVACITTEQALVVAGGCAEGRELDTVEVMDLNSLEWSKVCPLPRACSQFSGVVCQDALYLAGGTIGFTPSQMIFSCSVSDLLKPTRTGLRTQPWKEIKHILVTQSTLASFRGHLLVIGGCKSSKNPTPEIYIYNPRADLWMVFSEMKNTRSMCLAVTLPQDRLIIVGGYTQPRNLTDTVEILE
jgi:N-acetylneuraminic acid mutarotase